MPASDSPRSPLARALGAAALATGGAWTLDLLATGPRLVEAGGARGVSGALWLLLGALAAAGTVTALLSCGLSASRSHRAPSRFLSGLPVGGPIALWAWQLLSGPSISHWPLVWPARILTVLAILAGSSFVVPRWVRACHRGERPRTVVWLAAGVATGALWLGDAAVDQDAYLPWHHATRFATVVIFAALGYAAGPTLPKLVRAGGAIAVASAVVIPLLAVKGVVPGNDPWARRVLLTWARTGGEVVRAFASSGPPTIEVTEDARRAVAPLPPAPTDALDRFFPGRERYNVVFVTVDTVRADRLSLYGYERPTSPALEKLATEAVVFERAYAQYPSSSLSFLSMMTGRYATAVVDDAGRPRTDLQLFGELASSRQVFGVTPLRLAYVESLFPYLTAGLSDLDTFKDATQPGADRVLAHARKRIDATGQRPWLAWIHLFDPHAPYAARHVESLKTDESDPPDVRYDGEIAWIDQQLGRFIDWLRARPDWDRTVLVVHSDHGEGLGDHGVSTHGGAVWEEQVRVPLIVRVPGAPAQRVAEPVELVDLLPTLEELIGVTGDEPRHGHSLVGHLADPTRPDFARLRVPVGVAFTQTFFENRPGKEALVTRRWKLIRDLEAGTEYVFDLDVDPGELNDLALDAPSNIGALRTQIAAFRERAAGRAALVPDTENAYLVKLRERVLDDVSAAFPIVRDALAGAPSNRRALCARWLGLVHDDDAVPLLRRLAEDSEPLVATTAIASLAFRGDDDAAETLKTLPGTDRLVLEAWRIVALAAGADGDAVRLLPPLIKTRAADAENLVAALRLREAVPVSADLYMRLAFQPTDAVTRRALIDALDETALSRSLPLLRCIANPADKEAVARVDAALSGQGHESWADALHRIRALLDGAHDAAQRRDVTEVRTLLERAAALAGRHAIPDWGVLLELRILQSLLPDVQLPPAPDGAPPLVSLLRDLIDEERPVDGAIEGLQVEAPRPLTAESLLIVRFTVGDGHLRFGLQDAGPQVRIEILDPDGGVLEQRSIPMPCVPTGSPVVPFAWNSELPPGPARLRVSVTTVLAKVLASTTLEVTLAASR